MSKLVAAKTFALPTVVPAKAGTHTPCLRDQPVAMGSRFRGNDGIVQ
jgi:hypothetical protein